MNKIKHCVFAYALLFTIATFTQLESEIIQDIRKEVIQQEAELVKKGDFRELEIKVINIAVNRNNIPFNQKYFITTPHGKYRDGGMTQEEDIKACYTSILSLQQKRSRREYESLSNKIILSKKDPVEIDYSKVLYEEMMHSLISSESLHERPSKKLCKK